MAQFPPLGERLGQGWNRKMSKPLRHEKIATTSEIYGDLGLEAKRRIQRSLINFVKEQVPAHYSVKEPNRYLSHEPFGDCLQSAQKNGSFPSTCDAGDNVALSAHVRGRRDKKVETYCSARL